MPGGRPTDWTAERQEQAIEIIEAELLRGRGLSVILANDRANLPSASEFYRWREENPQLWDRYTRAAKISGLVQVERSGEPLETLAEQAKENPDIPHALVALAKHRSDSEYRVGRFRSVESPDVTTGEAAVPSVTVNIDGAAADMALAAVERARVAKAAKSEG